MIDILGAVGAALIGFLVGWIFRKRIEQKSLDSAERMAESILTEAAAQAETLKNTAELESKDEWYRAKTEFERESGSVKQELNATEKRIAAKEQTIDRKADMLTKKERDLQQQDREFRRREQEQIARRDELDQLILQQNDQLERVAAMTTEEAKSLLLSNLESQVREDAIQLSRDIKETARQNAVFEAKEIITQAVQRCATDHVVETTVAVVELPDNEMKGRIIGREGRNIRAFQMATGIDVVVDDTPNAVILSGFDPTRREVARLSLEKLVQDGRIHPGFIEQIVAKTKEEMDDRMLEVGSEVLFELGIHGMKPEIATLLGRMKYMMTCGQNALDHSREVAELAGLMAEEMGLDPLVAKRGGLLHDIGKAADDTMEGTHAEVGREIARKYGESAEIQECIAYHQTDRESASLESVLVQVADKISTARPGAQCDTLEKYVNRLRRLEALVESFQGVEKAYAVKAGQEVRVIIDHEQVDDLRAVQLASEIARRIQIEMEYPGQIKITVLRESRAIEYAK
jgi:ribonucrease Y